MPEDWRGNIHPENEGWGGDSAWDQVERNRNQSSLPREGEVMKFRDFTPCQAIAVGNPTGLAEGMFSFAEAIFLFILPKGKRFSPAINAAEPLDTDGLIDWAQAGRPVYVIGGENGTLIFKGKPTNPSRRSQEEFFFGLDQADDGTKLNG